MTESIPSKPEPEEPDVSYVTITLTIDDESTTASVVQGSTYTFSAPSDDLAPEGKAFISWSDAEDTEYLVGSTITASSDMTFTANLVDDTVYARFNGMEYETLTAALDAVKDAGTSPATVELLRDVTNGDGYSFATGSFNVTIDLRGNTYTFWDNSVGSTGTETQGFQILKDNTVTIKNGTLNIAETTGENGIFKMVIQNYSNLTLEDVVVDGTNLKGTGSYTISNNYGDSTYSGTTSIIAKTEGVAFDVYYVLSSTYVSGVSVTIKDSTVSIDGSVEYAHTADTEETFRDNAHLIIPEGYQNSINVSATDYASEYITSWVAAETEGYLQLNVGEKIE